MILFYSIQKIIPKWYRIITDIICVFRVRDEKENQTVHDEPGGAGFFADRHTAVFDFLDDG